MAGRGGCWLVRDVGLLAYKSGYLACQGVWLACQGHSRRVRVNKALVVSRDPINQQRHGRFCCWSNTAWLVPVARSHARVLARFLTLVLCRCLQPSTGLWAIISLGLKVPVHWLTLVQMQAFGRVGVENSASHPVARHRRPNRAIVPLLANVLGLELTVLQPDQSRFCPEWTRLMALLHCKIRIQSHPGWL